MKTLVVILSVILVGSLVAGWFYTKTKDVEVTYLLPEGLEGCVSIHFFREGKPELEIVDDELLIPVPESGTVFTSSPSSVITNLGWHMEKAFYVNEKGERTQEIDPEKFANGAMISSDSPFSEKFILSFDGPSDLCQ